MIDQEEEETYLNTPEVPFSGDCPKCGESLDFDDYEFMGEKFAVGVECPRCGFSGTAFYRFTFEEYAND